MRLLHLQCLQDLLDSPREIADLLKTTGLAETDLRVLRPFDSPIDATALEGVDAITIGGSGWAVFEVIPHYAAFSETLREARRRGLPMFGICFGAQALADIFGGKVVHDAANTELGTIEITREASASTDPIFQHVPPHFLAQAWHHCRIVRLPNDATALGWSRDGHVLQIFRLTDTPIWGVQFHPERDRDGSFQRLTERLADDPVKRDARIAELRESPHASTLLKTFVEYAQTLR